MLGSEALASPVSCEAKASLPVINLYKYNKNRLDLSDQSVVLKSYFDYRAEGADAPTSILKIHWLTY